MPATRLQTTSTTQHASADAQKATVTTTQPSTPQWQHELDSDQPLYFWKPHESWGLFGQWYMVNIYDEKSDFTFNCCEQYMMYYKAKTFNDTAMMAAIREEKVPAKQKKLGQRVKGFKEDVWNQVKFEIVVQANMLKFGQCNARQDDGFACPTQLKRDVSLKELLLGTRSRLLVEASSLDKIWGIGFNKNKADTVPRSSWGQNLLGKALMEVRSSLAVKEAEAAK